MNTSTPSEGNLFQAINFVMDRFDFEKTRRVMEFLDWRWNSPLPPTIDELKSTAMYLLTGCVQMFEDEGRPATGMQWATGGFQATVNTFSEGRPSLSLLFYVDTTHSAGEY